VTESAPICLEILSQPRFVCAARAMVAELADRIGFNSVHCGQVSLAVDEALTNVIKHGYERREDGRIWIRVWQLDDGKPGIKVVVEDRARQVDPQTIRSRDLDDIRPGGLGVHIIKEVMDSAEFTQREGGGMRLTMVKYVPPRGKEPASPAAGAAAAQTSCSPKPGPGSSCENPNTLPSTCRPSTRA
jgi:anti-sigma regulatory factor (Ser/Thr protein kinase)